MSGPTKTQGEHTFADDIVISGDEFRGYTASEELTRAEPVEISGDYEVSASTGDAFAGLATYSVAAGETVNIAGDDCEVRLELAEPVEAGDGLTADGDGAFVQTPDGDTQHAVANEGGGAGDFVEAYVSATEGNEAV